MDILNKAFSERSSDLLLLRSDPDFDSVHGDPPFRQMVARVGFPESAMAFMKLNTQNTTRANGR